MVMVTRRRGRIAASSVAALVLMTMLAVVVAHAWSSTQYLPSVATSFFQIGTVTLSVSIA